jgi:hypothetical protein
MNRREFARHLGVCSSVWLSSQAVPVQAEPASHISVIDNWMAVARNQWIDERLDEAAWESIRHDLENLQHRSRLLDSVPLTNADEPATVFRSL